MNRFESMSSGKRVVVLAGTGLLICALLAALFEGGVRVRQWLKYGSVFAGVESLYHDDPVTGLRTAVPGLRTKGININALGFRGPEITDPKPAGTIRIAFMGGSTTISAEVGRDEATWPHLVTARLRERWPDHRFDYINAGVSGYTAESSLKNLERRVKRLDPDLIVIYHATNDLSVNGYQAALAQGVIEESNKGDMSLSWPSKYSLLWYLVEKNLKVMSLQNQAEEDTGKLDADARLLAEPFERDLIGLVEASREVADVVALVTFSIRMRADQDQATRLSGAQTSLYYMPYMTPDSLIDSFAAYNDVIREVGRALDVIVIEGEDTVPGDETHFMDSVHFSEAGSQVMANRVADDLIGQGALQRLGLPASP